MSVFRRIFGVKNKKDKRRTNMATVDTILKLQETENFLIMKLALLEKKIEQEIGIAKKNITNKRVAFFALKRKQRFEKQLQLTGGILSKIQIQLAAFEHAIPKLTNISSMKNEANVFKFAHQHLNGNFLGTKAYSSPIAFG